MKTPLRVLTTGHRSGNVVQRGGVVLELALLSPACLLALYAIVTSVLTLAEQRALPGSSPIALRTPDTGTRALTPFQAQAQAPYARATTAPGRPGAAQPVLLADHAVQPVASLPCADAAATCTTAATGSGEPAMPGLPAPQASIPSEL
ncbi:hypothetical protein AAFF27_05005 [Xylophilus sp. GW821-FHT01B05]